MSRKKDLDPILRLADPEGNLLVEDDDGGGYPQSRIFYTPRESGEFRLAKGAKGDDNALQVPAIGGNTNSKAACGPSPGKKRLQAGADSCVTFWRPAA